MNTALATCPLRFSSYQCFGLFLRLKRHVSSLLCHLNSGPGTFEFPLALKCLVEAKTQIAIMELRDAEY